MSPPPIAPTDSFTAYFKRPQRPDITRRGQKRTKIIATVGPACDNEETLRRMYHAGMNVARFNMSHGSTDDHQRRLDLVRRLSIDTLRPIAALVDLQGPKMRIGDLAEGANDQWTTGDKVVITVDELPEGGSAERVGCSYRFLARDLRPGNHILVDDGKLKLEVTEVRGNDVHCLVIIGGTIRSRKGINLPDAIISAPSLSKKDLDDLNWAIKAKVDYLALSFVRNAADVRLLKSHLITQDADIPVIAKIERPEAVENVEEILAEADGIMVARGDLGIEISTDRLPVVQKHLITRANAHGKLVITATQMLESMIESPIPTRAESSDVANAIFDGTDAVMLSGETAAGDYPTEAVQEMAKICIEAENSPYMPQTTVQEQLADFDHFSFAICGALDELAKTINARAIAMLTENYRKVILLSKKRNPRAAVICCTDLIMWRRTSLLWGTAPLLIEKSDDEQVLLEELLTEAQQQNLFSRTDTVVLLMGLGRDNDKHIHMLNARR